MRVRSCMQAEADGAPAFRSWPRSWLGGWMAVLAMVAGLALSPAVTGYSSASASEVAAAPAVRMDVGHTPHHANCQKKIALFTMMRGLWTDHVQWTYKTVDAFFHNQEALQPTLDRLLRNQTDIGAAFVPYYGQAAGDKLADLLTTHIQLIVPVLEAAQAGDDAAFEKALDDWYANAKEIADFLSSLNPENWPRSVMEPLWKTHIDQTTVYSIDLLKGDYAKSIKDVDEALDHMLMLSDILSKGIIAQFPDKFCE
ncbi:hypothetical protein [Saccharopolyspora shandongensis]|uniref:hypothetical protein n=1 Tax=Saccharopolyspora shandongensis TaxID=418495 RepID=UPI0033C3A7BE